jgi:hypothetical protein
MELTLESIKTQIVFMEDLFHSCHFFFEFSGKYTYKCTPRSERCEIMGGLYHDVLSACVHPLWPD